MIYIRLSLAVVFAIIGIIGVFLPILQGWPFLILSFLMFFPRHRLAEKTLQKIERRLPRLERLLRRVGVGDHQ
jgi:uncharacterized membrane protein YbaN (DUF454 family)